MALDFVNVGPSVEIEVAQEFCLELRLMRNAPNGENNALQLLDSVLLDLHSQKQFKLVEAIIRDLEHCQNDFVQKSTFYQNLPKDYRL